MRVRFAAVLAASMLSWAAAPGASAVTVAPANSVFDFNGVCSDCTGVVHGRLTLANYTLGSQITSSNFVSFFYDGSDIMGSFSIRPSESLLATGSITAAAPAGQDVYLDDGIHNFFTDHGGGWSIGEGGRNADYGSVHSFALAATVPEPASLALLLAGVISAGLASRRQRPWTKTRPSRKENQIRRVAR